MMNIQWLDRPRAMAAARKKIIQTDTVLDIGCGIRPQTYINAVRHVCVEPHLPYIERLRRENPASDHIILNCEWFMATSVLDSKSFDTVFIIDMIEHIEKEDGKRLVEEAERLARKQIVIFTPLGWLPQTHEDGRDRWGMDGGYWQTHRSGWTPEDFSDGWEFICCKDFHKEDQHGTMEKPFGAFWAIRTFGGVSQENLSASPKRKKFVFNFGVGRNMVLRSFFLISIYSATTVTSVKRAVSGLNWFDAWPMLALPLWWLLDYFILWRQEVDANFMVSKEWQQHKDEIKKISQKLSQLEQRIQ